MEAKYQNPAYAESSAYGAAPAMAKQPTFLKTGHRNRLNIVPMLITVFVPWLMFSLLVFVLSLSTHYEKPFFTFVTVGACVALTSALGVQVFINVWKRALAPERYEPSWSFAMFILMLLAFVSAVLLGEAIYSSMYHPYINTKALNVYSGVDPSATSGERLMDAGVVNFVNDTQLDLSKAMSFWNELERYCVAPIVRRGQSPPSYDYWAVGVGCCDTLSRSSFHCPHFSNLHAHSGYRDMSEEARGFFRLAVQQAEAWYGITAAHPVFLQWSNDALEQLETHRAQAEGFVVLCVVAFFMMNGVMVALFGILFTKLGHN